MNMNIVLRGASIVESAGGVWMQTYCENGLGLILRCEDKEKGRQALEQLVESLRKPGPQSLDEFRKKIERIVGKYAVEGDNFSLGALRIVDEESYFYTKRASVFLSREKKVSMLLADNGVISGPLRDKDKVLILDKEGIESLALRKITELLGGKLKVETIVEELLLEGHRRRENTAMLGLAIEVGKVASQVVVNPKPRSPAQSRRLNIARALSASVAARGMTTLLNLLRVRKAWFMLGFILLAVFSLLRSNGAGPDSRKLSESLELARHQYEEGEALIELNRLRARDVLIESKTTLENLSKNLKKGGEEYKNATALLLEVEQALKKARSAYKVEPELFFDLSLIRDGLTANLMKQRGNSVFLLSTARRLIATVNLETKASKVLAGDEWFARITRMAVSAGRQVVLSPAGVREVAGSKRILVEADEEWGQIVDLAYFGGNLYLLDKKGLIWKYISADTGFSEKRNYLKGDLRLKNPSSMAIDGAVWVMDDGRVLKFISGRRDSFYVRGLDDPPGTEAQIVKTPELADLYILDKQKGRIVVLGEDGTYKSQYGWEGLKEVDDFAVSEDLGKIFLLKKDKIYTVQLE